MIRVILPVHLKTLAKINGEALVEVEGPITQRAVLSQLSKVESGAWRQSGTTISATSARAASCGANSRGEQSRPGTSNNGVLVIRTPSIGGGRHDYTV